jgi:ribonuclease HI
MSQGEEAIQRRRAARAKVLQEKLLQEQLHQSQTKEMKKAKRRKRNDAKDDEESESESEKSENLQSSEDEEEAAEVTKAEEQEKRKMIAHEFIKKLKKNENIWIEWKRSSRRSEKWAGHVIDADGRGKVLIDFGVVRGQHEYPSSSIFCDVANPVYQCSYLNPAQITGIPPLNHAPILHTTPERVIYCDGGTTKFTISAAAITVHRGVQPTPAEEHALYVPVSTNNICEYISLIAALNYIKKNEGPRTLVIVDSEVVYKQVAGTARCQGKYLTPLHQIATKLYTELNSANRLWLAHMLRGFGNKADPVVARTKAKAQSIGDLTLFPTPPVIPAPGSQEAPVPRTDPMSSLEHVHHYIKSATDFIRLRQLKTRSKCPKPALPNWTVLVKETLVRLVNARNDADTIKAFKTFLLLPTVFLPASSSTRYVVNNILAGRPYNVAERLARLEGKADANATQVPPLSSYSGAAAAAAAAAAHPSLEYRTRAERSPLDRLAATATRLAQDRKLRSAMKIIQQESETGDMNFDSKVAALKEKFLQRRGEVARLSSVTTFPFARETVIEVLQKMSRNAATCIDGWTKDLLLDAIFIDREIADLAGSVCAMINNGSYPSEVMELVRMGRLVGIPKPDGGIRPIVISSFLAKLTGSCVLFTTKVKCAPTQFAVGKPKGALRVVHLARTKYDEGKAIIRIDSSNAFNVAPREVIARALRESAAPSELKRYFDAMYIPSSKLVVYGPGGRFDTVDSEEGVRQGDAASTLLFCKVMDMACAQLMNAHTNIDVWSYVDDLTIACEPAAAKEVANSIANILQQLGFQINMSKSAVTAKSPELIRVINQSSVSSNIHIETPDQPFKMLGAIINASCSASFMEEKSQKLERFLQKLEAVPLHAQLKWTFLRLCGAPKFEYLASSMPPKSTEELLHWYDVRMKEQIEKILDADVQPQYIHDQHGANFPCYSAAAAQLYEESLRMALNGSEKGADVQLVLNILPQTAGILSQQDASFTLFSSLHPLAMLDEDEFITAMCIRLRTLPRTMDFPRVCSCDKEEGRMQSAEQFIDHALKCKQLSTYSQTSRHNRIRDTLAAVARNFGISTTVEPTFYIYDSSSQRRPDIVFHLPRAVATDVAVVHPTGAAGESAKSKAKNKIEIHQAAVARFNHEFIPFVLETYGRMDSSCKQLIEALKKYVPVHLKTSFEFHMYHSISCALAKTRAATIRAAQRR